MKFRSEKLFSGFGCLVRDFAFVAIETNIPVNSLVSC